MNLSDILADLAIERQLDLNRYVGSVQNDIARLLKDMVDEIESKLRGDLTEYNQRRLERLLSEIKVYVAEEYGLFFDDFESDLIRLAQDETRWVAASMNQAVGSSLLTVLPSADALKTLVKRDLLQGAPLEAWFKEQSRDVQFRITNAIRQGVAQGETNGQIMARLKGIEGRMASGQVIPIVGRNLEALTRTAVQSVTNKIRNNVYEANADVVKALQQISTLDSRTSQVCIAYSGKTWDVKTKEPVGHSLPFNGGTPRHWNCLPGDSLITACGGITGASKRWFDGEVFVINTASGNEITCTPNHPILTNRGWVKAQFINESDKIACGLSGEREGLVKWDDQKVVPTIKEVTDSFFASGEVVPMPVPLTSENFHGDASDGDIAVVGSNSCLSSAFKSVAEKEVKKGLLVNRGSTIATKFVSFSHFDFFGKGRNSSLRSLVCFLSKSLDLLWGGIVHSCLLLLGPASRLEAVPFQNVGSGSNVDSVGIKKESKSVTRIKKIADFLLGNFGFGKLSADGCISSGDFFNPVLGEDAVDYFEGDTITASDLLGGCKGPVKLDDVTGIFRKKFSDHVYNLETVDGFYASNGIINHNCRSTLVPVTKSFRELGLDVDDFQPSTRAAIDGQVAADQTFEQFLERKGKEFQDRTLGAGRADLWREGKITLTQLLDARGRPLTLTELRAMAGVSKTEKAAQQKREFNGAKAPEFDMSKESGKWSSVSFAGSNEKSQRIAANLHRDLKVTREGGGAYAMGSVLINMPPKYSLDSPKHQATWRHELGHIFDAKIAEKNPTFLSIGATSRSAGYEAQAEHRSSFKDFQEATDLDAQRLKAIRGQGKTKAAKARLEELKKRFANNDFEFESSVNDLLFDQLDNEKTLGVLSKRYGVKVDEVLPIYKEFKQKDLNISQLTSLEVTDLAHLMRAHSEADPQYFFDRLRRAYTQEKGNTIRMYKDVPSAGKFTDFFGSTTRNKVLGFEQEYSGHPLSYYKQKIASGNGNVEQYANLFALYSEPGQPWWNLLRHFAPNQTDLFLKDLDTYGRDFSD